LARNIFR